jgi:hypothetical protein
MEYRTLTGISHSVINELRDHMLRTLEIRSPRNFLAALDIKAGEGIFLTSTSAQDLTVGTVGVLGQVVQHQIATHRIINGNDDFYEERETTIIRLQLKPRCPGRVRRVLENRIGEVTVVEAEAVSFYDAR